MENNSPYIYEKPLRGKRSIRNRSIAAVGLVAIGSVIGGGAFASSIINEAVAETADQVSGSDSALIVANSDAPVSNLVSDLPQSGGTAALSTAIGVDIAEVDPIFSIPVEQAQPKKNTPALELPAISAGSFGNTSSATPVAGGGQTGSNIGTYKTRDHDDEYTSQSEGRDHDDDDDDDEYEYEDED